MKKLLIVALLLTGINAVAGVRGDKIHFQKDSTWVSAAFSKSLCLNEDTDTYEAKIRKCFEWERDEDNRVCTDYRIVDAFQPRVSTRQRCAQRDDDDKNCTRWVTVPYVQKRVKKVEYLRHNDDNDVYKTEIITIPACN